MEVLMKKKVILFNCLVLVFCFNLVPGSDFRELKFVREISTNTNDNLYFKYVPNSFDVDSQGNIYIISREFDKIFKVSPEGKLLKEIGKSGGLGPGDIIRPEIISVDKDTVAVTHSGRVSFFTKEGKFKSTFKMLLFIHSMFLHENQLYCLQPFKKIGPVTVFNFQGKLQRMFGETYKYNSKIHQIEDRDAYRELHSGILVNNTDQDCFYFVSSKFGDIFKYNSNGKFIKKHSLKLKPQRQQEIKDYYFKNGIKKSLKIRNAYTVMEFIKSAAYCDNWIYLLYIDGDRRIKHGEIGIIRANNFKETGLLRFYNPAGKKIKISTGHHLVVKKIDNKIRFYISVYDFKDDEAKIMIFEK